MAIREILKLLLFESTAAFDGRIGGQQFTPAGLPPFDECAFEVNGVSPSMNMLLFLVERRFEALEMKDMRF